VIVVGADGVDADALKERHTTMSVDFENANRAPMLFIAFSDDRVVPPKPIQHMADKHTAVPVEYKEFSGRPHFPGVPGWEEVADYALDWAAEAKTPATVSGNDGAVDSCKGADPETSISSRSESRE
jgi:pimeloyl-ACP methyl ester carboxylesterase